MKEQSKPLLDKLAPFLTFVKRYTVFGFFIAILMIFSFLVYRINLLTNASPTDDQVTQKLQTVQRPHIDQATLKTIQQLQDQHVNVKSLFDQARNNPFSE